MDAIDQLIVTLHDTIGHDKAALVLGVPPGDKAKCLLCAYNRNPTEANRRALSDALGGGDPNG